MGSQLGKMRSANRAVNSRKAGAATHQLKLLHKSGAGAAVDSSQDLAPRLRPQSTRVHATRERSVLATAPLSASRYASPSFLCCSYSGDIFAASVGITEASGCPVPF